MTESAVEPNRSTASDRREDAVELQNRSTADIFQVDRDTIGDWFNRWEPRGQADEGGNGGPSCSKRQ
jgi:transposase